VLCGDCARGCFLVAVGTIEVANGSSVRLGDGLGAANQRLRQLIGVVGKLLDQQFALLKIAVDPARIAEQPTAPAKTESIKTGKHREDKRRKAQ
jgi:hypothetical protein